MSACVCVCVYLSGRLWTLFTIISKSVTSSNKNTRNICHTHLLTKPPTRNRWQGKHKRGKWISSKQRHTGKGVYIIHTHTYAYLQLLINNTNFKFKHAPQTFNQVLNGNAEGQLEWIRRHSIAKTQTTTHHTHILQVAAACGEQTSPQNAVETKKNCMQKQLRLKWTTHNRHSRTHTHSCAQTQRDLRLGDRVRSLRRNATELRLLLGRDFGVTCDNLLHSLFTVTGRVATYI